MTWQEPPLATVASVDEAIRALADRISANAADLGTEELMQLGSACWHLGATRENLTARPMPAKGSAG